MTYFCRNFILRNPVSILSIASVSPIGFSDDTIRKNYFSPDHAFETRSGSNALAAYLDSESEDAIAAVQNSDHRYKSLDRSVLMAIAASRKAVEDAGWKTGNIGINIGSSRGATAVFEKHHLNFIKTGRTAPLASPTSTLGNISSWVAQDLRASGPDISHSITCSTALHALLNGIAWLGSGMADKFLVGGSEAPLTAFTISQMQSMKIYAKANANFPCRSLDFGKTENTMILGEAASVCTLESGNKQGALAVVHGIGYATEALRHATSISAEAECFQKSMRMALATIPASDIDAVVMHAPGTIAGDLSEFKAIEKVFGRNLPPLTGNKWKLGHTFGASGMLSIEMAILMLQNNQVIGVPFAEAHQKSDIKKVLVNSVGFGGNAVSVVIGS